MKDKLNKLISHTKTEWKANAFARMNQPWLMYYSSQIARRVLSLIEDNEELNQRKLADTLNVSAQQISKIVQGKENLTLETIYKLSKALNFELISFPEYKYSVVQPLNIDLGESSRKLVTANSIVKSPNECLDTFSKENQMETASASQSATTTNNLLPGMHKVSQAA